MSVACARLRNAMPSRPCKPSRRGPKPARHLASSVDGERGI